MKRRCTSRQRGKSGQVEAPDVDAFLDEIKAVCEKHGLCIAHEDSGGAFIIMPYNEQMAGWIEVAQVTDDVPGIEFVGRRY